jgi:hypothetical protein
MCILDRRRKIHGCVNHTGNRLYTVCLLTAAPVSLLVQKGDAVWLWHGIGRYGHLHFGALRASPAGQHKQPLRVRTHPRGQNTRPSGATQTNKAVQRRPRAPIPVSNLGLKCVGPDSPLVLSRPPPCPPQAQPTVAPNHFPSPPLCFPAACAPPPFPSPTPPHPPPASACLPRPPKRSLSFHRTLRRPRPPLATR